MSSLLVNLDMVDARCIASVTKRTSVWEGMLESKQYFDIYMRVMGFMFAPTLIACLAWAVKSYNMQQSNAVTASPVRSYKAAAARFPSPVLLFLPFKRHMCRRVLKQLFSVSRSPVPRSRLQQHVYSPFSCTCSHSGEWSVQFHFPVTSHPFSVFSLRS